MPTYDPIITIQKAVFKALRDAQITLMATPVPTFEFVPQTVNPPYILISQQTCIPSNGSTNCKVWECTLLLDILTTFSTGGGINSDDVAEIAAQVLGVLEDKRLELSNGFQMSPAELIMSNNLVDNKTKETIDVHRFLRFSFSLEYHQD
ncbi:DUF3168 domain-containing protein [Hymenobacter aerilatus]|uniref:DUF3168 domain-containing protein n=1 Tax=Hymenobacter aerilatus TaxID=2932251 RepID=A0A8T9SVE8_9BACT|nr:DUF3168 domain-containing protein [Hymenobacter aerilatus]UOR05865.1 DUF3168 domain-containing protein [Hymenobacter aerilatus]